MCGCIQVVSLTPELPILGDPLRVPFELRVAKPEEPHLDSVRFPRDRLFSCTRRNPVSQAVTLSSFDEFIVPLADLVYTFNTR